MPRHGIERPFDLQDITVNGARDKACGKFRAGRTRDLEQLLLVRPQTIDPAADHDAQFVRDIASGNGVIRRQPPLPVDVADRAAGDQIVDHRHQKERLPQRALEHPFGQHLGQFGSAEPLRQILPDIGPREPVEGKPGAIMMDLQIIMDGPHRIYAGRQFGRTIGDHHQHRRLATPPRQARQHVKGG